MNHDSSACFQAYTATCYMYLESIYMDKFSSVKEFKVILVVEQSLPWQHIQHDPWPNLRVNMASMPLIQMHLIFTY